MESKAESSVQGKVGSLGYTSDAVPNFCAFGLEDSFYLCDKFSEVSIILKLVGEENIIGVFPSLVGLLSKLSPDPFTSINIRVEHVLNASCIMSHVPGIYGLMGSSFGCSLLCCLKGGEVSELLGHFCAGFLAFCDQLVDLCCLVPA